ncbi:MAG TPA: YjgN family protein [Casimicrobiaceae bacterium]|nr:YjgN family protein [Casimicrobiaceae bacterium]
MSTAGAARDAPPPRPSYGARDCEPGPAQGGRAARAGTGPAPDALARSLEPGPLRDELLGPAAAPEPAADAAPGRVAQLQFTGEGGEYFRIWIVNLLLTVVTLGIYSAWAKVRKTRYFWQNTRLEGHAFDFHGRPVAILAGRIVALLLLAGYSFAFEFSSRAGLAMIAVLCVVGPWLFMRAQRFRLGNTSWRGLRFGYASDAIEAYRVALPPLLVWFSGTVLAVVASHRFGLAAAAGFVSMLLVPWMHHRLKAYQHRRARYGGRAFAFEPATRRFYATYVAASLVLVAGFLAAQVVAVMLGSIVGTSGPAAGAVGVASTVLVLAAAGLLAWPYFAARLQAVVWSHTRIGDVRFATAIAAGPLAALVARNVLLTLVTAGLYWPYAAVALARYRVECMRAESEAPLLALAVTTTAAVDGAAGDAALDAFGLDIGL